MKKSIKKGAPSKILASCGSQGCDLQPYVMPYAGTNRDFRRHAKERFKNYPKQAA